MDPQEPRAALNSCSKSQRSLLRAGLGILSSAMLSEKPDHQHVGRRANLGAYTSKAAVVAARAAFKKPISHEATSSQPTLLRTTSVLDEHLFDSLANRCFIVISSGPGRLGNELIRLQGIEQQGDRTVYEAWTDVARILECHFHLARTFVVDSHADCA
jgi:hypothetical protein